MDTSTEVIVFCQQGWRRGVKERHGLTGRHALWTDWLDGPELKKQFSLPQVRRVVVRFPAHDCLQRATMDCDTQESGQFGIPLAAGKPFAIQWGAVEAGRPGNADHLEVAN